MQPNSRPVPSRPRPTLIFLLFLAVLVLSGSRPTASLHAQEFDPAPMTPEALAATSFTCTINNIASFGGAAARIHIRCAESQSGIIYFSYPDDPADVAVADQMLAVANTAFALGRSVVVFYDTDSAQNPAGCNVSDCRRLIGVSML